VGCLDWDRKCDFTVHREQDGEARVGRARDLGSPESCAEVV